MTRKTIPLSEVEELVSDADSAFIVISRAEPVPTLGDVPPERRRVEYDTETYEVEYPEDQES